MEAISNKVDVKISIEIDQTGDHNLFIYDIEGKCIKCLLIKKQEADDICRSLGIEVSIFIF